jgi:hypothetical protein
VLGIEGVSGTVQRDAGAITSDAAAVSMAPMTPDAADSGSRPSPNQPRDTGTDPSDAATPSGTLDAGDAASQVKDASTDAAATSDAMGADASSPDSGPGASSSVHGKLIDFRRHALPGVSVTIGKTSVVTDAQGQFQIDAVAATYDAALSISVTRNNVVKKSAWLFEGLTRRDPTLQVYDGLANHSANCLFHLTNVDFAAAPNQIAVLSFGGPDGEFQYTMNQLEGSFFAGWVGSDMTQGTVHALRFERDPATDLVTRFLAYAKQPLALSMGAQSELTFNLGSSGATTLPTSAVMGSVTGPGANSRTMFIDLRFIDGAVLDLAIDSNPPANFSYLVPSLSNATATIVATEGALYPVERETLPFALARVPSLAGQTGLRLSIPSAATLAAPATNTGNVAATTMFSWVGGAQVAVLSAEIGDVTFYVVTTKQQAKLPAFPITSLSLPVAAAGVWHVQTHGSFQSVDDAANVDGFLDEDALFLRGPQRGPGTFTLSEKRTFMTAP